MDGDERNAPLGEKVKYAREAQRLSQSDLAKRIGVSRAVVAKIESGVAAPDPVRAVRLASSLGEPPDEFLLLSLLQHAAIESESAQAGALRAATERIMARSGPSGLQRQSTFDDHVTLLDFPNGFPGGRWTVIVGDKREEEPQNAGDLFVFSASTVDDRWIADLGLPEGTQKLSDKFVMTADQRWKDERFGSSHILCIGSPASNLFAREYNDHFLFRFALSFEAVRKWTNMKADLGRKTTRADLLAFAIASKSMLKQTMRLFKQPGFVNFLYPHLKLGIDVAQNRDFAVISLGRNPFNPQMFAVLVAGVHHPGTANAVRFLANPHNFETHPFGGILEIQVPSDRIDLKRRSVMGWHDVIELSEAVWHSVSGGDHLAYKPNEIKDRLQQWVKMIEEKKEKIITDVWESDEEFRREILHHITLIDQLAAAKVAVRGDRTTTASEAAVPR